LRDPPAAECSTFDEWCFPAAGLEAPSAASSPCFQCTPPSFFESLFLSLPFRGGSYLRPRGSVPLCAFRFFWTFDEVSFTTSRTLPFLGKAQISLVRPQVFPFFSNPVFLMRRSLSDLSVFCAVDPPDDFGPVPYRRFLRHCFFL